jgi:hypothetical protein
MECKIPALIWLIEVPGPQGPLDRYRGAGFLPGAVGKGGGGVRGRLLKGKVLNKKNTF